MPGRKIVENKMREFINKAPKGTETRIERQEVYSWLVSEGISIGEGIWRPSLIVFGGKD